MPTESTIRRYLLRHWRETASALDSLTDRKIPAHEAISRFSRIVRRWPVEHQALALFYGGILRDKKIRIGGTGHA